MTLFSKRSGKDLVEQYKEVKSATFDFHRIALFFNNDKERNALQILSDRTFRDLDFEELFMLIDRTCSKPGQQYLYATIRTITKNKDDISRFESTIDFLKEHQNARESTVLELSRLSKQGAFYLQGLIFKSNIRKPAWFWLIPALSYISFAMMIITIFNPAMILVLLAVIAVNFVLHFWNKSNMLSYSNSIPQLIRLNKVTTMLLRSQVFLGRTSKVRESNEVIGQICRSAIFFKVESKLNSEIGQIIDTLLELIKASFLLEPIMLFRMIRKLDKKKNDIKEVFEAVGHLDVAQSILSLRETLPYYCIPQFTEACKELNTEEIYHPLIIKPVSNSIALDKGKSILISGSNMSGKTTFIRTIGLNVILSQTINTVFAKKMVLPQLKVHSAITISDNLLDATSYYFEEVKTIYQMIAESKSDGQNLFLLDEIFKGTNTVERIASGKSVLTFLNRHKNIVFVSSHDLELTELLMSDFENYHFTESIENDQLKFDYKLKAGKLVHTNAIRILELNKYPKEITDEAKNLAKDLKHFSRKSLGNQ